MGENENVSHKRIKDGDISTFELLFKEFYAPLCLFAFKYVKDKDVAEEIVQDFFYSYWKDRSNLTIRISLKAYFYMAIRNNALKHLRQLQVRLKHAQDVRTREQQYPQSKDPGILEGRELHKMVEEILNQLPERCGVIFRMSRYEGMKYKEIAETLSVSVKTVEANMGKALQTLRVKLKEYNDYAF